MLLFTLTFIFTPFLPRVSNTGRFFYSLESPTFTQRASSYTIRAVGDSKLFLSGCLSIQHIDYIDFYMKVRRFCTLSLSDDLLLRLVRPSRFRLWIDCKVR